MCGGPTYRAVRSLIRRTPISPAGIVLTVMLLITFAPMIVLAWRDGALISGSAKVPLLQDWFVLARFLGAMPLLILTARLADGEVARTMRQLSCGGVVSTPGRPMFERLVTDACRVRDSMLPELLCLVLAFAPSLIPAVASELPDANPADLPSWQFDVAGVSTAAGSWLTFVAAPLFRFVLLLWMLRLLLWSWLLWRFSRLDLNLRATHPDRACGLAFLGFSQSRFTFLFAAGAIMVCGNCINEMIHDGKTLTEFRYLIVGYVLGSTALLMGPLLLLIPPLARARRRALISYDTLGQTLTAAFDAQWKPGGPNGDGSGMLENPAPSAMADFSSMYANIVGTRVVPVSRWNLAGMALGTLAPFAPLAFIATSVDELARRIMSLLL